MARSLGANRATSEWAVPVLDGGYLRGNSGEEQIETITNRLLIKS